MAYPVSMESILSDTLLLIYGVLVETLLLYSNNKEWVIKLC